jgi:hypothetical protein
MSEEAGKQDLDRKRRLKALERERDAVKRMLEQGSLDRLKREVDRQTESLDDIDESMNSP